MSEKIPGFIYPESAHVLKEREIYNLLETVARGREFREVSRHEDESGVYRLVVEAIGDDGDPIQYDYVRAGNFPNSKSKETAVDIIYLDSERNPVGGMKAGSFINGVWTPESN